MTPDITADSSVQSESYWRHEQDITADIVRQMDRISREAVPGDDVWTDPQLYNSEFASDDHIVHGAALSSFSEFRRSVEPLSYPLVFMCSSTRSTTRSGASCLEPTL